MNEAVKLPAVASHSYFTPWTKTGQGVDKNGTKPYTQAGTAVIPVNGVGRLISLDDLLMSHDSYGATGWHFLLH